MDGGDSITQLLEAAASGDPSANNALFDTVYRELRTIARSHRRRWSGNDTMNTTALIHEAYAKMASAESDYNGRVHFFATASKAMRQILVNYAEKSAAAKRGGGIAPVTLSEDFPIDGDNVEELVAIGELLEKIEAQNPRDSRLFECRVFGGMTVEETAAALGVSPATVKRDWSVLSAWVYRELQS